jgi:HEAT repeat protein
MHAVDNPTTEDLPRLRDALKDPDPRVRAEAAREFELVGDDAWDSLSDLRKLLADSDGVVRKAAQSAVATITDDP